MKPDNRTKLIAQIKAGDIISPEVMKSAVVEMADENERLRGLLNGNGWSGEDLDKDAEIARLRERVTEAVECLDAEPEYHTQGMGCGLEDRCITDRYEAMTFGWESAMERVHEEAINPARAALEAQSYD